MGGPFRASVDMEAEPLTLRRDVLDAEQMTAAIEAGATLAPGMVLRVEDRGADRGGAASLGAQRRQHRGASDGAARCSSRHRAFRTTGSGATLARMRPIPFVQCDVADLPAYAWDAIVVGGGPAGSMAALRLARAGHRVLVLERRQFPRDKACGDALIPDALAALARNGLLDRVARRGRRWARGTAFGPFRASVDIDVELLTIRRMELDAELVAAAVEAGATLAHAMVRQVDDRGDAGATVWLAAVERPLRARLVCIATGASVSLLERCGLLERAASSAVAIRTYVHSSLALDRLVVSFDRKILPGYGWIFPMGDGVFNVGCGVVEPDARATQPDLRGMLDSFLATFPLGRELVAGERRRETTRGAMLRYALTGARPYAGGAVLAAGESIGSTFPLTGEGIGKAMETAELASALAAEALRAGTNAPLAEYAPRLARDLRPRYAAYEAAQRWIAVPGLADLLFHRARRRPRLRAAFSGMLHETVDPSRVISPRGLVRALLA